MKKKIINTKQYFNERSKRYGNSLNEFPYSRLLDLIPYLFVINYFKGKGKPNILDVFGGTGFLATSFQNLNSNFFMVDGSKGMLDCVDKKIKVETILTKNNLKDIFEKYGENSFDMIFSHGGFHHVLEYTDNKVNVKNSQMKQIEILKRLEKLLKPGGIIVIADISNDCFEQQFNNTFMNPKSFDSFKKYLSKNQFDSILKYLNIKEDKKINLFSLKKIIKDNYFNNKVKYKVPNYFFDEFAENQTKRGHNSCYLNFEDVHNTFSNLEPLITIDFPTPWVFKTKEDAGWFFREKFSIGKEQKVGESKECETKMYNLLEKYLGTTSKKDFTYINWGVTYGIYKKI